MDETAAPAAGGTDAAAPADGVVLQDTALNGAQVTALLGVLQSIASGTLDQSGAVALITSSFPTISSDEASAIVSGAKAAPSADAPAALARSIARAMVGMPPAPPAPAEAAGEDPFDLGTDDSSADGMPASDLSSSVEESSVMELTGEQVEGLLCILGKLSTGELTKDAAAAAISVAFPAVAPEKIQQMVDGVNPTTPQPEG
jgi:hypothetical protein